MKQFWHTRDMGLYLYDVLAYERQLLKKAEFIMSGQLSEPQPPGNRKFLASQIWEIVQAEIAGISRFETPEHSHFADMYEMGGGYGAGPVPKDLRRFRKR